MSNSVNTNVGAQIALRNLSMTNTDMSATQKRISTGLKVADAYDDGAAYAVTSKLRSDISVLGAVNERLSYGQGLLDVTVKSGENMTATMKKLGETITKLGDENTTGDARTNYEAQYKSLTDELTTYVQAANYNGTSLMSAGITITNNEDTGQLDTATSAGSATNVKIISSTDGSSIAVRGRDVYTDVVDGLAQVAAGFDPTGATPSDASVMSAMMQTASADGGTEAGTFVKALATLGQFMNDWGNTARTITDKIDFNNAMTDANTTGLGAIADADMAKESAKLQSLQVKQQLGTQSLSMANQTPQSLLSLFR